MATTRTHHKKLSRKELKQPDEFHSFVDNAQQFLLENLQQVLVSAGIVLLAGVIAIAVYYYEVHRDAVAGDRFYTAMTALNQKNYKEAAADFDQLAKEEPSREVGKLANFYLGNTYFLSGDLEKAQSAYVAYLANARDPLFTSLALEDLGVVYEKLGDFKKAQGAYSQAAGIPGPEQSRAELNLARMLAQQGDKHDAIDAYQRFLAAHPFSQDRQAVVEALAQLGAAPMVSNQGRLLPAPLK